jgi:protein-disulfide isomerase
MTVYAFVEVKMITIKIFGTTPPCVKCKEIEKRAINAAVRYRGQVTVVKFDALSEEGDKYGVLTTPTVVINEKVASAGKLLSEKELEALIQKEMEVSS